MAQPGIPPAGCGLGIKLRSHHGRDVKVNIGEVDVVVDVAATNASELESCQRGRRVDDARRSDVHRHSPPGIEGGAKGNGPRRRTERGERGLCFAQTQIDAYIG